MATRAHGLARDHGRIDFLLRPWLRRDGGRHDQVDPCERLCRRLPQVMPDTSLEPLAMSLPITAAAGIRSHISVPIIRKSSGEPYGMFCCVGFHVDPSLNGRDLQMMNAFAELASFEINREIEVREIEDERVEDGRDVALGELGAVDEGAEAREVLVEAEHREQGQRRVIARDVRRIVQLARVDLAVHDRAGAGVERARDVERADAPRVDPRAVAVELGRAAGVGVDGNVEVELALAEDARRRKGAGAEGTQGAALDLEAQLLEQLALGGAEHAFGRLLPRLDQTGR